MQVAEQCKVIKCSCPCPFQDMRYGFGKRVGNMLRKRDKTDPSQYRCTVCGKVK